MPARGAVRRWRSNFTQAREGTSRATTDALELGGEACASLSGVRAVAILGVVACLACGATNTGPPVEPRRDPARRPSNRDVGVEQTPEDHGPISASMRQLVLVRGGGWDDIRGRAQRFERVEIGGEWRAVGEPFDVVFGHAGLAWGHGLHGHGIPPGLDPAPNKSEGDGRSPAGVFSIGAAYGRAPSNDTALPYAHESASLRCIDDPSSAHYNRIVDAAEVNQDWASAEPMRRYYDLAIVVEHNPDHEQGAGSCIFLHPWKDPDTPVTGCTAMDAGILDVLAAWLDPDALIVTLPGEVMVDLREAWSLPAFPG